MARRRGSGRVIDMKQWSFLPAGDQAISVAGITLSSQSDFLEPGTILRSRGYVQASMDASKQVNDTIGVAFGLGIVSTDAATLGSTAMPGPFSDPQYPWLWFGTMFLRANLASGQDEAWGVSQQRLEVDTKAMRRFKPKESLVWVIETASLAGGPATNITTGFTRVLIGT